MNKENNMEMSTLDVRLPKYYKGYNIDVLIKKILDGEQMTKEEENTFNKVYDICYKKHFEENQKKWDDWKKAHPGEYTKSIHPQRTDKR